MNLVKNIRGTDGNDILEDGHPLPGVRVKITAYAGDDLIIATGTVTAIDAGAGDDLVYMAGGTVADGDGNDTVLVGNLLADLRINNGAGDDWFDIAASEAPGAKVRITDGAGSDFYLVRAAGLDVAVDPDLTDPAGEDSYFVNAGKGSITYAGTTMGITLSLDSGAFGDEIGSDHFQGFTRATGGSGNDTMYTGLTDGGTLIGGAGDDWLEGFAGNDVLSGGDGWDNIYDHGGYARIDTGSGDANVIISATGGSIVLGDGTNLFALTNDSVVSGGRYTVTLNSLSNSIVGTDADETFVIRGDGFAAVDLQQNGTVVTALDNLYIEGSAETNGETVQLTGAVDRYVGLESGNLIDIDRLVTGAGNDVLYGSQTAYNALTSSSGNDEINCVAEMTDVSAGRGDDLVLTWGAAAHVDMGSGLDRVFCREGTATVVFDAATAGAADQLYLFDFTKGLDLIDLDAGTDAAAFMAHGHDAVISDMSGVQFTTAKGAMLFIAGLTAADLSLELFV